MNNIQSTSLTLTVDSGKKMTLVFEEATPLDLSRDFHPWPGGVGPEENDRSLKRR